jgi:hypothetical protein
LAWEVSANAAPKATAPQRNHLGREMLFM